MNSTNWILEGARMKYVSYNHLEDFEFHDSVLEFESYKDNTLVVTAKYLNIHKDTKQNTNNYDAEIAFAVITFECFKIHSLELLRSYRIDADDNMYTDDPQIIYRGKDAENVLIRELQSSISLNGLNILRENERITIELENNGNVTMFAAICSCTKFKVEWDEYCGRAWYEKYKRYQYDVILVTPCGKQKNVVTILHELDNDGNTTEVSAYIRYHNKDYFGNGTDYLWIDAIADLQKKLPEDVMLKCCVACRHGSLCPVGNSENEVFCVSDISPKDKSDLFFYTEDENERTKRSREYFNQCENFESQKGNYYTYNDFYYHLKK